MKPIRLLGLTGSIQHGKMENRPVFEGFGWHFLDINVVLNTMRKPGTSWYASYQEAIPGSIDEEGRQTGAFFAKVTATVYRSLLHPRLPEIASQVQQVLQELGPEQRVVINWGHLGLIAQSLQLDHTWLFTSEQSVWYERLRNKARALGMGVVSDSIIVQIVESLDIEPMVVHERVLASVGSNYSVIDVSGDNWGAAMVSEALRKIE